MFYRVRVKDHIRVPPNLFGLKRDEAILKQIREEYQNHISKELNIVLDVEKLVEVKEGVVIPGDGAAYFETTFDLITFKTSLNEAVLGRIKDITDFGAFISIGPIEGMIHISQTMDDYVSFSKDKVLQGRDTKRTLKVGDLCRARIVAVSYKDPMNPKIGLTMRQPGLGKLEWLEEKEKKKEQPQKEEQSKQKKMKKK